MVLCQTSYGLVYLNAMNKVMSDISISRVLILTILMTREQKPLDVVDSISWERVT
jgi:hypothetical protein